MAHAHGQHAFSLMMEKAAEVELPQRYAAPSAVLLFAGIALAYRSRGAMGLAVLLSYIIAVILVQLVVKELLHHFPYPMFICAAHMLATTFCSACAGMGAHSSKLQASTFEWWRWYAEHFIPLSVTTYLSIAFNNCSLVYLGAGLSSLLGLATPVITAAVAALFGLHVAPAAWLGIAVAVAGDTGIAMEGLKLSIGVGKPNTEVMWGLLLSLLSLIMRGVKTVFADRLLNPYDGDERQRLQPMEVLFLLSPPLAVLGLLGTLLTDGAAPWLELPGLSTWSWAMLIVSIVAATYLNTAAVYIIKMLGAPASQIASKLNILVTAVLSCALFGERLTFAYAVGTVFILAGAGIFEKAQHMLKVQEAALLMPSKAKMYDGSSA
eukprot:TRINITY_DN103616_c0_g1_i1.p1 TRINITY_DN103616_c0_g1~~TRINITY_DN103616_c0_g1_i1.p1  ORF type:complete len:379 (-),score=67.30 TRINITY_DN103616_c0_g1_i1:117-1253(-)